MERAVKHEFIPRDGAWRKTNVRAKIDPRPFGEGGMRFAFRCQIEEGGHVQDAVAKLNRRSDEGSSVYFCDIETQMVALEYANDFNKFGPAKRIRFLPAWVLEMTDRRGGSRPVFFSCEPYIKGEYVKHNDNYGRVFEGGRAMFTSQPVRNTPQAYTHFTYESSNGTLLVADIQGVGDVYTDPQIHTLEQRRFGAGNLGLRGMQKFFESHRCNEVCSMLGLPPRDPRDVGQAGRAGGGLRGPVAAQAPRPKPVMPAQPGGNGIGTRIAKGAGHSGMSDAMLAERIAKEEARVACQNDQAMARRLNQGNLHRR